MTTGVVIAAAGMSSRMNAFKPMLPLGGSTVIRTEIAALLRAGVGPVAVVTGNRAALLREHLKELPVTCLFNPDYRTGQMFGSVRIGLRFLSGKCGPVFFLPADVPLFSADTLRSMLREMERTGAAVVKPTVGGEPGHPILLSREAADRALSYRGADGLRGALLSLRPRTRFLPRDGEPGLVLDADTPEDYQKILALSGNGPEERGRRD